MDAILDDDLSDCFELLNIQNDSGLSRHTKSYDGATTNFIATVWDLYYSVNVLLHGDSGLVCFHIPLDKHDSPFSQRPCSSLSTDRFSNYYDDYGKIVLSTNVV